MTKIELVQSMVRSGVLKTPEIINAFEKIDRAEFVREQNLEDAYNDYPLNIGQGATISQPSTVAFMLELLAPREGDNILDVGSGSGWTTALLAHIVGSKGKVYGIDIEPELVEFGRENIRAYSFKNVVLEQAGEELGLPKHAPYDKILVSAAAKEIPKELIGQLKVGGRMIVPVQSSVWKVERTSETGTDKKEFFGFSFVPLR